MTLRLSLLLLSLSHLALAQRGALPRPPSTLIIDNVTLIDGTGASPRADMRIVVRNGIIAELKPASSPPDSGPVIDARGLYVIPGLIDGHVHLNESSWESRADLLKHALAGGITAVWDMANDARVAGDLARAVFTHEIPGPTIYYSALMAGRPFFRDPRVVAVSQGFTLGLAPWAQAVSDSTDMPRAVAMARGTGATSLKLYASLDSVTVVRATAEAL